MKVQASTRQALIGATIDGISRDGLDEITIRTIAGAVGCSTAGIFLNFAGKEELLEAAIAVALEEDRQFHEEFAQRISGLVLTVDNFADVITSYVELRTRLRVAPIWLEVFFKAKHLESGVRQLAEWVSLRQGFWADLLDNAGLSADSADILNTYLTMEEVYALALHDRIEFQLMLRETARAFAAVFLDPQARHPFGSQVASFVNEYPDQFTETKADGEPDPASLRERLLSFAIPEILTHGIRSLNLRRVVKRAGTSMSMIAYHFGDTASFVNEAVWRALMARIPAEVDPYRRDGSRLSSIEEWTEIIARLIRPNQHEWPLGFYVGSARLIGQAALMARREQDLLPVILHLRRIEGTGTFRSAETIWPQQFRIERSAAALFGIWVKGQALINETVSQSKPADGDAVMRVVLSLIGVAR